MPLQFSESFKDRESNSYKDSEVGGSLMSCICATERDNEKRRIVNKQLNAKC